ncbi:hypothetical protein FRC11_003497 [Ceratobasidium sp. 423]|nr:hypothetical protein FRC11_003497 [Ceratobasidium sp. 423]
MATSLCFIMLNPMVPDIAATGLYVPPSCFLSFIHVFGRSLLGASTIRGVMEMILQRLRAPSVPLPQLPPEILPFPEPRPSIEYLQQLTRLSGGFLALVRAGSIDEDYANVIPRGIAYITVIAANRDPALSVDPVELHTPAVPGFLEALSWALPHLLSLEGGRNLYNQFLVAASILLVVACEDPESREKVAHDSGRTKLLVELRDNKDIYLGMISKVEWRRLVNGLALGEVDAEETGSDEGSAEEPNNESDGESIEEPQADAVLNMNEVVIGNTDPNEVEDHGENTLHTSLD